MYKSDWMSVPCELEASWLITKADLLKLHWLNEASLRYSFAELVASLTALPAWSSLNSTRLEAPASPTWVLSLCFYIPCCCVSAFSQLRSLSKLSLDDGELKRQQFVSQHVGSGCVSQWPMQEILILVQSFQDSQFWTKHRTCSHLHSIASASVYYHITNTVFACCFNHWLPVHTYIYIHTYGFICVVQSKRWPIS